jgi:hypothetical protein
MNTSEKASALMGDDMSVISNGYSTDDGIGSSVGDGTGQLSDARDEVKEVHKRARKETTRVRMGKLLVLLSILVTAAIVSAGTYILLKKDEDDAYEDSVSAVQGALLLRLQLLSLWWLTFLHRFILFRSTFYSPTPSRGHHGFMCRTFWWL